MKLPCEMIQDLLPLYHDGVCSEVSKALVTEHLKNCKDCANALKGIDAEIEVPKLEADAAKPLKSINRKWKKRTWRKGMLIGLVMFLLAFTLWFELTQNCSVVMTAEEYTINRVYRFSNGMYYLEYSLPYEALSYCADIHRTDSGEVHLRHYRPRLVPKADEGNSTIRSYLIDPAVLHADSGKDVPMTAFYLGCPETEDAVLLWSADMDIPMASPEIEARYLYNRVFQ